MSRGCESSIRLKAGSSLLSPTSFQSASILINVLRDVVFDFITDFRFKQTAELNQVYSIFDLLSDTAVIETREAQSQSIQMRNHQFQPIFDFTPDSRLIGSDG